MEFDSKYFQVRFSNSIGLS